MKTATLAAITLATFTTAWLAAIAQDTPSAPATNAPAPGEAVASEPAAAAPEPTPYIPLKTGPAPTNGLVLNFHDVPLNAVLSYLSAKAGLFIVSDVNLQGKVSVVALQPISTNDIVDLLNDQLGKNNYAAVLNGRTLTIMDQDRAKTYALTKIRIATNYAAIPVDDEIVTEIMPLHTLNAQQLVKDLDPLIPRTATVTANEAGNSIIMTAQQKDVRRVAEIINDLDGTALSEVVVTVLNYADAKSVAAELKEVFQSDDSTVTRAATRNQFGAGGGRGRFGGGGGNPMAALFGGGGGGGGGGSQDASKNVQTHAVFVSDDQLNAVVSSAPPDYMHMITNVIAELDKPSQEITVLKRFALKHADPGEISDELSTLFPSGTTPDQNTRTMGFQFRPFMMGMGQQGGGNSQSPRMKQQTMVTSVPDRRTQSIVVSASKDMMEQIEGVIKELDAGTAGVQKVTAIDFGGADPATVELTMEGLFSAANSPNRSSTQTATPMENRYQGNANSQTTTAQSTASSTSVRGGSGGMP